MTRTYLYGYGSGPWGASVVRRTRENIEANWSFANVHPELMRRAWALADDAQDAGTDWGFGSGDRNTVAQDAEFRRRHYRVSGFTPIGPYDGSYWQRHSWAAPYAYPGKSWHERSSSPLGGLSLDQVGDHVWATARCRSYGLVNMISNEAWHYQPIEIPFGRKLDQVWPGLNAWPLPGNPPPPPTSEVPPVATLKKPIRILDTRASSAGKLAAGETRRVGVLQPPATWARAAIVDIGVSDPEALGFIVAWSGEGDKPDTSNQDFPPGSTSSNLAHVALSGSDIDGWGFSVFALVATHLVVDLQGYDSVI